MDPEQARKLLAAERARIERALVHLEHQDTGEPADEVDPGNLASELYQDEFDEVWQPIYATSSLPSTVPRRVVPPGRTVSQIESGKPIPDERLEAVPTAERTVEEEGH